MLPYFSTFTPGLESVVERWLREDFQDATIDLINSGLVIFGTETPPHLISKIRFFNSSFVLVARYKLSQIATNADEAIDLFFQDKDLGKKIEQLRHVKGKSFRLTIFLHDRPALIDAGRMEALEGLINDRTDLKLDRRGADREFCITIRPDRTVVFGLKITPPRKAVVAGDLSLDMANSLCRLSEPTKQDVIVDPFCSFGSIVLERMSSFPYKFIYAVDADHAKIKLLEGKTAWTKEKIKIIVGDTSGLSSIIDGSVDKIITYLSSDLGSEEVMAELGRILKQDGMAVLLTKQEIKLDNCELKEKLEILIAGQKMNVLKLLKV